MSEIWKDIEGYENIYQVSNKGNVRSLQRLRKNRYGEMLKKGVLLKKSKDRNGYESVVLANSGKERFALVHRLVAQAFIPHTSDKNEVNHIDEDKSNNRVENLEWCDRRYNMNYGTRPKVRAKPVIQQTPSGYFIERFASANEAERKTGVHHGNIAQCCRGIYKTAGGFRWIYG